MFVDVQILWGSAHTKMSNGEKWNGNKLIKEGIKSRKINFIVLGAQHNIYTLRNFRIDIIFKP